MTNRNYISSYINLDKEKIEEDSKNPIVIANIKEAPLGFDDFCKKISNLSDIEVVTKKEDEA